MTLFLREFSDFLIVSFLHWDMREFERDCSERERYTVFRGERITKRIYQPLWSRVFSTGHIIWKV